MPTIPYVLRDGTAVKGATTLLSCVSFGPADPLIHWGVKLAKAGKHFMVERELAAKRGTRLHLVLEEWPNPPTRQPDEPDDWWMAALQLYAQLTDWLVTTGAKVELREKPMVSEQLKFGGCPDLVIRLGDELVLCDLKTGKSWGEGKTIAQLAAYQWLLRECEKLNTKRAIVLHFGANQKLKPIDVNIDQLAAGWRVFECALTLHGALGDMREAA